MNYQANTIHWRPGDLVLHDADAKTPEMLMVVLGYDRVTGECRTKYVKPDAMYEGCPGKRVYRNWIESLHDPGRFGIPVPNSVVKPEEIVREGVNTMAHAEIYNYILSNDNVTATQIVAGTGFDREVVESAVQQLFVKGFIWKNERDAQGEWRYFVFAKR